MAYEDQSGYANQATQVSVGDAGKASVFNRAVQATAHLRNTKAAHLPALIPSGDPNPGHVCNPYQNGGGVFTAWRTAQSGDTLTLCNVSQYEGATCPYLSGNMAAPKGFQQRLVWIDLWCTLQTYGNLESRSPGGDNDNWIESAGHSTNAFFVGEEMGTEKMVVTSGDARFEFNVDSDSGDLKCLFTYTGSSTTDYVSVIIRIEYSPIFPTS